MKAIILAAGEGKRLRPLTETVPKCMVAFRGKPLMQWIAESMHACGIRDIVAVTGYKSDKITVPGLRFARNPRYAETNMVSTLFCAEHELAGDVIVSYSDIVYLPQVLDALIKAQGDFCVTIDRCWDRLWALRMENPLADAETLKLDGKGNIIELGKKAKTQNEIQGQYMGLFKISGAAIDRVKAFYHSLDKAATYDGKNFENMYMTSFIQAIIDKLMPVLAVPVDGGWLEIDSTEDFEVYNKHDYLPSLYHSK
jgi:choline kinase